MGVVFPSTTVTISHILQCKLVGLELQSSGASSLRNFPAVNFSAASLTLRVNYPLSCRLIPSRLHSRLVSVALLFNEPQSAGAPMTGVAHFPIAMNEEMSERRNSLDR